jgi:hypothetical protein
MSQSSEILKLAVYDDRCFSVEPKYAVQLGGTAVTNTPFRVIGANNQQLSFQAQISSEGVYVDRSILLTASAYLSVQVAVAGTFAVGDPVAVWGNDMALSVYPLHTLTNTISATINNTTITTNNADTMYEILRLVDMEKSRAQSTCPSYLDTYANYDDGYLALNSPLNGFANAVSPDRVPNGAYYNVAFTNAAGVDLLTLYNPAGPNTFVDSLGQTITFNAQGIPVGTNNATPALIRTYGLYFRFTSTEQVLMSPFIFSADEDRQGMAGIQNIQLLYTMNNPGMINAANGRVLRTTSRGGRTFSALAYNSTKTSYTDGVINVTTISPPMSLNAGLPAVSMVPYLENPRYVTNFNTPLIPGINSGVATQTITLPSIPDGKICRCVF